MFELTEPRRLKFPTNITNDSLPEIFSRGDVTIFTVNHRLETLDIIDQQAISRALRRCDHLLLEGTHKSLVRIKRFRDYASEKYIRETFLTKYKRKSVHMLEDGLNIFRLANKYGMDVEELWVYIFLNQYSIPFVNSFQTQDVSVVIDEGINRVLTLQDDFKTLNVVDVKRRLVNIYRNISATFGVNDSETIINILLIASSNAILYTGFLREYEFLIPNVKRLVSCLHGRKGIVIGKMHLDAIEKALEGVEIKRPINWPFFINKLPEARNYCNVITRLAMSD